MEHEQLTKVAYRWVWSCMNIIYCTVIIIVHVNITGGCGHNGVSWIYMSCMRCHV